MAEVQSKKTRHTLNRFVQRIHIVVCFHAKVAVRVKPKRDPPSDIPSEASAQTRDFSVFSFNVAPMQVLP